MPKKVKQVRDTWTTAIKSDPINDGRFHSLIINRVDNKKFQLGDKVRVTVTLLTREKPRKFEGSDADSWEAVQHTPECLVSRAEAALKLPSVTPRELLGKVFPVDWDKFRDMQPELDETWCCYAEGVIKSKLESALNGVAGKDGGMEGASERSCTLASIWSQ